MESQCNLYGCRRSSGKEVTGSRSRHQSCGYFCPRGAVPRCTSISLQLVVEGLFKLRAAWPSNSGVAAHRLLNTQIGKQRLRRVAGIQLSHHDEKLFFGPSTNPGCRDGSWHCQKANNKKGGQSSSRDKTRLNISPELTVLILLLLSSTADCPGSALGFSQTKKHRSGPTLNHRNGTILHRDESKYWNPAFAVVGALHHVPYNK